MMGLGVTMPTERIGNCPVFDPHGYQQWRREVKLRPGSQAGATATQLLSKIITKLPLSVKTNALNYMGEAGKSSIARTPKTFDLLDARYGKTDTEKTRMLISQFA